MSQPTIDATTNLPSSRLVMPMGSDAAGNLRLPAGMAAQLGSVVEIDDERITLGTVTRVARASMSRVSQVDGGYELVVNDASEVDANPDYGIRVQLRYFGDGAYGNDTDLVEVVSVNHATNTLTLANPVQSWSGVGSFQFVAIYRDGVAYTPDMDSVTVAGRGTERTAHARGAIVSKVLTVGSLLTVNEAKWTVNAHILTYFGGSAVYGTYIPPVPEVHWNKAGSVVGDVILPLPANAAVELVVQTSRPEAKVPTYGYYTIRKLADGAGVPLSPPPALWYADGGFVLSSSLTWTWTHDYSYAATADVAYTAGKVTILTAGTYHIRGYAE